MTLFLTRSGAEEVKPIIAFPLVGSGKKSSAGLIGRSDEPVPRVPDLDLDSVERPACASLQE